MTLLVPDETRLRLENYLASLQSGSADPGKRLVVRLAGADLETLTEADLLEALLNTKVPQIFAESAVAGDGSDWNLTELQILGDISVAVPVTIFDNGHHTAPVPHTEPFTGTLVFTPGALLRNGRGQTPADWAEVTLSDGNLNRDGYYALYERRLLPVFQHVNDSAAGQGKQAVIPSHQSRLLRSLLAVLQQPSSNPRNITDGPTLAPRQHRQIPALSAVHLCRGW